MQHGVDVKIPGCCSWIKNGIPGFPLEFNFPFLQSLPGAFQIAHTFVGIICLSVIAHSCRFFHPLTGSSLGVLCSGSDIYFLLVTFACSVTSVLVLVTCLLSHFTASFLPKTAFEFAFHLVSCVLYLSASLTLLVGLVVTEDGDFKEPNYPAKMAASVFGLINAILYGISSFLSFQSHRQLG